MSCKSETAEREGSAAVYHFNYAGKDCGDARRAQQANWLQEIDSLALKLRPQGAEAFRARPCLVSRNSTLVRFFLRQHKIVRNQSHQFSKPYNESS
jgi:hypothetical protein